MARSHGQIKTSIWSDSEFLALTGAEQLMYLQLVTQSDVSLCGVVAATVRRWSSLSCDGEPRTVVLILKSLADKRFLVVDQDTEEVFIRSFMRNDGVARKSNIMKSALRAARGVRSKAIRGALAKELRRIDVSTLKVPAGHESVLAVYDETLRLLDASVGAPVPATPSEVQGELFAEPSVNRSPSASPEVHAEPFAEPPVEEEVVVERSNTHSGFNSSSVDAPKRVAKRGTRIPDDFAIDDRLRAWAAEEAPQVNLDRETAKFIDYWRAKSGVNATKLDWAGTWRNWIRSAAERLPAAPGSGLANAGLPARPSTTDQRMASALEIGRRMTERAS